jgi:hypothetical protein
VKFKFIGFVDNMRDEGQLYGTIDDEACHVEVEVAWGIIIDLFSNLLFGLEKKKKVTKERPERKKKRVFGITTEIVWSYDLSDVRLTSSKEQDRIEDYLVKI